MFCLSCQVCSLSWNPAFTCDGCVIWFPGSLQSLKIKTAFPSASLSNIISREDMWCELKNSSHYKMREELSLSTQEKACHCAHTMIIYPAKQENAEEST